MDAAVKPKTHTPMLLLRDGKMRLLTSRLTQREMIQRDWFADVPEGTPRDAVLDPGYWMHFTKMLQPRDMIRVCCEDGSWGADLFVIFISADGVKVTPWPFGEAEDAAPTEEEEQAGIHVIKWHGPKKFAIVDKTTGVIIKDELYPKSMAVEFLKNHIKRME